MWRGRAAVKWRKVAGKEKEEREGRWRWMLDGRACEVCRDRPEGLFDSIPAAFLQHKFQG